VNVVDANVLLYAVNVRSERHDVSRRWLDHALSGGASVGLAWNALLAFVRLSTKASIFPTPLDTTQAFDRVEAWLSSPAVTVVEPGAQHASIMRQLLAGAGSAGNLVNDAHLAALAIERRGTVVSFDSDFERFDGVSWTLPG
jgi:hypothetical protein